MSQRERVEPLKTEHVLVAANEALITFDSRELDDLIASVDHSLGTEAMDPEVRADLEQLRKRLRRKEMALFEKTSRSVNA